MNYSDPTKIQRPNESFNKKMANTSKINLTIDYKQFLQLPQTEHAKNHLKYVNMGFKIQIMLQDLSNILYWSSVVDLFLFIFTLSCFMTSPKVAGLLFIHIIHVLRAVCGGFAVFKLPKSSRIIDDVRAVMQQNKDEAVEHQDLGEKLNAATETMFKQYNDKLIVIPVIVYFVLTCLQFVLDFVVFCVALAYMSDDVNTESYAAALMLCLSSVFISLDLYYIIWVASFKFKMPTEYSVEVITALIGFPTKLRKRYPGAVVASTTKSSGSKGSRETKN